MQDMLLIAVPQIPQISSAGRQREGLQSVRTGFSHLMRIGQARASRLLDPPGNHTNKQRFEGEIKLCHCVS